MISEVGSITAKDRRELITAAGLKAVKEL